MKLPAAARATTATRHRGVTEISILLVALTAPMGKREREDTQMSKKMPTSPFDYSSSDDASNQVPSNSQDYFNNRPSETTSNPYRLYPNRPQQTTSNPYRLYPNRPQQTTSNPYRLYPNRPPQTTSNEYSQFNNQQVQSSSASTDDPNHVRLINHLQFNSRPQQTTSKPVVGERWKTGRIWNWFYKYSHKRSNSVVDFCTWGFPCSAKKKTAMFVVCNGITFKTSLMILSILFGHEWTSLTKCT
ncbi:uncharacterized protein LOC102076638 isoform X2 [Oreochromis niloticus]|uniref:uncharacterized protein LOC102076638 isoform X2 n=1 Tax=Oreochromis niloticus TaxID=8128 RepID=UPI000DF24D51|nr:uncharacterized protein LOC102076638 isoform X2 [Oreochromis niloticus]